MVVDNKRGAGGTLGAAEAARADPADGPRRHACGRAVAPLVERWLIPLSKAELEALAGDRVALTPDQENR
jgi:tripartite-type tricarboxylate transporter receptor subunit TctC